MNKELETSVMLIEAINSAVKKINTAKEKNEQELITDDEMQRRLGVSRTTLYNWRKDGTIPYLRIGKKLFYRWKEIINKLG
ncbi:MAG: helix-turn-helix transcriptional regulator [Bacteroidota bacterium]|jgi:excisionase family DNA binding protein